MYAIADSNWYTMDAIFFSDNLSFNCFTILTTTYPARTDFHSCNIKAPCIHETDLQSTRTFCRCYGGLVGCGFIFNVLVFATVPMMWFCFLRWSLLPLALMSFVILLSIRPRTVRSLVVVWIWNRSCSTSTDSFYYND